MVSAGEAFCDLVPQILRRFCTQNGLAAPLDVELAGFAQRLWALVNERGLPPPLRMGEQGEPGELPEAECDALVARVLGDTSAAAGKIVAAAVRQLVKACFYAEFKICRDSFREVSPDGSCRRQQLARVRSRVSGSHCVDCPYWVALSSEQHVKFLTREWQPAGREELAANLPVFLPEDFREFRRRVRAMARGRI